jgi:hypothetical protein
LNLIVPSDRVAGVEVLTAHADGEEATAGGRHRDPDPAGGSDPRVAPVDAIVR